MYRHIVFAALLGGIGLGAWSSFSAPLKPPGLDFSALAATLQQHLSRSMQPLTELASVEPADQPQPMNDHAIFLNAALTADDSIDFVSTSRSTDDLLTTRTSSEDVCGAWSVSETGMEAILREMVRRGWTPPARSQALAISQTIEQPLMEALDPDSPAVPIFSEPNDGSDEEGPIRKPSKFMN